MAAPKKLAAVVLVSLAFMTAAEQSTPYVLTEFPVAVMDSRSKIWVKWTGSSSDPLRFIPDSGTVYFGTSPGGSVPANYPDSVSLCFPESSFVGMKDGDSLWDVKYQDNIEEEGPPPQRGIGFIPRDQKNMSGGTYYFIVANKKKGYYSNEMKIIVEVDQATRLKSPDMGAEITSLTPTFEWEKNPGVPYYHIILSDEEIAADINEGTIDGLSVIWQAITSNTQITYGAPDPSGTLTADPPPLSPGMEYSWVVLNNYGNHPAYTSKRFGLPRSFAIAGQPMLTPVNVSPKDGDTLSVDTMPIVTFRWTNLDKERANTYKIYVYVAAEFEGVDAQIVEWETEVTAGEFTGDIAELEVDAASIFTSNFYRWRVIAVDANGAGATGEMTGFRYTGVPTGVMKIYTKERIEAGATTIEQEVAGAKIEVQVLEGSLEAPPLFYTDNKGRLVRSRPAGSYRVTATKDGFLAATRTIEVTPDDTVVTDFYLERPAATIYGKVVNDAGKGIGLARVTGVSDVGDTSRAETDVLGNFVLNCSRGDWRVRVAKTGYITSLPKEATVATGQSANFGTTVLVKNPFTLSGVVKNQNGTPIIGVNVKLLADGVMIAEYSSTPQDGSYSFAVEAGSYTIVATKTGFATSTATLDVLSSTQRNITLSSGAALVKGAVYGKSWGSSGRIYAAITNATISLVDTSVSPPDTIQTISDDVWGDFKLSVPAAKTYIMYSSADGYLPATRTAPIVTEAGKTYQVSDTLEAMAYVRGTVAQSSDGSPVSKVTVTLMDPASWTVAAQAQSDAAGEFEMLNISDGIFAIVGGKEGFMVDSVLLVDTAGTTLHDSAVEISEGRAVRLVNTQHKVIESVNIRVKTGNKNVVWTVMHGGASLSAAAVKVRSPMLATLAASDTLNNVGHGRYVITVDADADSILDLSRHLLTVPDVSGTYRDSVNLPLVHAAADSMAIDDGAVSLSLRANGVALDTAMVYYRDAQAAAYDSIGYASSSSAGGVHTYTFSVVPQKNGASMVYYFRARIGSNVYGYEQETYTTFVRADATTITKMELVPSAADTMLLAADAKVTFRFYAYYGSKFVPDAQIQGSWVRWQLSNASGCGLNGKTLQSAQGDTVVVYTPSSGTAGAVVGLAAMLVPPGGEREFVSGLSDTIAVRFRGSASRLDSISVRRADVDGRKYITTAGGDNAEFVAQGYDRNDSAVTITPVWSVIPEGVGTLSARGIFTPSSNFTGCARIIATVNGTFGEYNEKTGKHINESGLEVHYVIAQHRDSVVNGVGCSVVLPDSIVGATDDGELLIAVPLLQNRNERVSGDYSIIGDAFEISEENGVTFDFGQGDSLGLDFAIPAEYQTEASNGSSEFVMALWNEDSLRWEGLTNSSIVNSGTAVRANVRHFSRYAILYKSSGGGVAWSIKPNPFSPYVYPIKEYGAEAPQGTCIEVIVKYAASKVTLQVFNVVGDKVLETYFLNPYTNEPYHLWWDGKGKTGDYAELVTINAERKWLKVVGERMCRNGRYFAVLTVKDIKNNEERFMKPIVVFK